MELILENIATLGPMLVLLCLSAFFSGSETAFFSLTREQITQLTRGRSRTAAALSSLLDNPSRLLVTILFGNMTVNILFFCSSAVIAGKAVEKFGDVYELLIGLTALVTVIISGEIIPKAIGVSYPVTVAKWAAMPVYIWQYIATPFRFVLQNIAKVLEPKANKRAAVRVNAAELKMLLDISQGEGRLHRFTGEMIEEIITLSTLKVKWIMTPRVDLAHCADSSPVSEAIALGRANKLLYLPVYRESENEPVGIVDIKELCLNAPPTEPIHEWVETVKFIPETKRAAETLEEMIREKTYVALVVDEYGGLAGLLTMEDILDEFTGETGYALGETDEEPVERLADNTFRVKATLPITEWKDYFEGDSAEDIFEEYPVVTIGGVISAALGRLPRQGDTLKLDNLRLTVERVGKRRAESVIIQINGTEAKAGEG